MSLKTVLLCASAFAAGAMIPQQSMAQEAPSSQPAVTPTNAAQVQRAPEEGDIIVTARRRDESIVDVPLAISVVTSKKLEQLDLRDTNALANYVPGLEFSNYATGYARNDRGAFRTLSFRGLAIGGAASLFLDGAAVSGNEIPAGMDIGQVEVLRGPQSVYFGRSTMTGAVSYRTKAIPEEWGGEAEMEVAQRNATVLQASVAGPVVKGLLGVRLTGLYDKSDGYTTNEYNNGAGKLGDRSRKSVSTTIDLTPASNLDFKAYVNYFRDDDGASATAFVPASDDNCTLPGATQSTFCGKIPGRSNSINYVNTTIPAQTAAFIFGSPLTAGRGFKDKVGGQRAAFNSDVVGSWEISDYLKLTEITAFHTNTTVATADGIDQPGKSTFPYSSYFYSLASKSRDFSQEVRLSSDPNRALSWTLGGNYINSYSKQQALVAFVNQANAFIPYDQGISRSGTKTEGIFGGVYYKPIEKLTFSAEGRYQWDKRSALQLNPAGLVTADLSKTFKSFNPRVSADYDVGGGRKVYVSYATGTDPGGFNTNLANFANNPVVLSEIKSLLGLTNSAYKEEKLKIGEIGLKGSFAGGKGYFDFNGYYGKLSNQQITIGALVPSLGYSVVATANVGETEIYGLEYQGSYNFTRALSLSTTFAWNHSKRTQYENTSGLPQFGTTDFSGVDYAHVPEFSGSAVLAYTHPISNDWNAFTNASYVYRGKQYVDDYNAAYIGGRSQIDLRVGISNDRYTIEAFARNILDDRKYTGGSVAPDYGTGSYNAFFGAVAEPRQIGGRLRVKI